MPRPETRPAAAPPRGVDPAALKACLVARGSGPVETIETRTSWVFLTPSLALKLKKPLNLGFLDFTRIASRRVACLEELRLNRRFSRGLYRRVIAVRGTAQAPRFDGQGPPIDHLVCMRRFPAGALLSQQLAEGTLSAVTVDRAAVTVADFHRRAVVARRSVPFGWPEQVLQAVLDVTRRLDAGDPRVASVHAWIEQQAWPSWDAWLERRHGGFVRECHGDLHLGNLARIGEAVVPFDCLEFNPGLRWTDVMSDVAFLAMDLEAGGRRDLAFRFLDAYLQSSGDFAGVRVLRFQLVYRALVRAMASAADASAHAADRYLDAAVRWTAAAAPRLLIAHGLSGSGKSSATLELLQRAGAIRVRSDVERARLLQADACSGASVDGCDPHSAEVDRRVAQRLLALADEALRAGFPVIVDATFLRERDRTAFARLARTAGAAFNILDCQADDAILRERIEARRRDATDPSDATLPVLDLQRAFSEPLTGAERAVAFTIVAGEHVDMTALAARWLAQPAPLPPPG